VVWEGKKAGGSAGMAWRQRKEERRLDNKIKVEKRREKKKGKAA